MEYPKFLSIDDFCKPLDYFSDPIEVDLSTVAVEFCTEVTDFGDLDEDGEPIVEERPLIAIKDFDREAHKLNYVWLVEDPQQARNLAALLIQAADDFDRAMNWPEEK